MRPRHAAGMMDRREEYNNVSEMIPRSESTEESQDNPRKRKKSSRACDFCHANHQPCDNAKPRCSYCQRHGKTCLYLRPQKKRGPAQGYRSALHTMRESAAAWGAALTLIPSLGPVVEGYLKQPEGKRLVKAIQDPQQQEFFIQAWQQSAVFKNFFGEEDNLDGGDDAASCRVERAPSAGDDLADVQAQSAPAPPPAPPAPSAPSAPSVPSALPAPPAPPVPTAPPAPVVTTQTTTQAMPGQPGRGPAATLLPIGSGVEPVYSHPLPMFPMAAATHYATHEAPAPYPTHDTNMLKLDAKYDVKFEHLQQNHTQMPSMAPHNGGDIQPHTSSSAEYGAATMSLSDIVARDAARSSTSFSQTLGSLGFAPGETLNDFLAISYNPDPMGSNMTEADLSLGSEMDQKAYYELLMGRQLT